MFKSISRFRATPRPKRPHHRGFLQARSVASVVAMSAMFLSVQQARAGGPIKHYIIIEVKPTADLLMLDRWYQTFHAPETLARTGGTQTRYVSFRTWTLEPREVARFNVWPGRMTEIRFDSIEAFRAGMANRDRSKITPPSRELAGGFRSETVTVPVEPQHVLKAGPVAAKDTPYFRWIAFYRYPKGVSVADGDRWLLRSHAPELARLAGVRRSVAYDSVSDSQSYTRVVETWFDTRDAWRAAMTGSPPAFTPPPWGGDPFADTISTVIGENPDVDFKTRTQAIP